MLKQSSNHKRPQVALGFDFGLRHIGVAVGQTLTASARPLTTLSARQGEPKWSEVAAIIAEWQPDILVVGIPEMTNNTSDKIRIMEKKAQEFAQALTQQFQVPVETVNEYLTTKAAKDTLYQEKGYKGLQKKAIDAESAKIILQQWLRSL